MIQEPVTTGPPFSPIQTDTSLAADEPASRKTRTRKSANQPNITNNPLFWRSQTSEPSFVL